MSTTSKDLNSLKRPPKTPLGVNKSKTPVPMKYRTYTDEERLAVLDVLDSNLGNAYLTAKQTGISRATIETWQKKRFGLTTGVLQKKARDLEAIQKAREGYLEPLKHGKGSNLADFLEELAWRLAEAMPSKIPDATLTMLATSFGILIDKMQILRGKPTTIALNASLDTAVTRIMESSGCDQETAKRALSLYVPAMQQLGAYEENVIEIVPEASGHQTDTENQASL